MKLTALEKLDKELMKNLFIKPSLLKEFHLLIEQAKELEKEQIEEAWWNGNGNKEWQNTGEMYFNKTFKN